MRKIKKINGFLVVRFNDREKRNYPDLGSFGVIDAEQYTGDIDFDRDAMEYTDADCIEVAVEQARGLESESDFSEEPPVCTVIVESDAECSEEEVEPQLMIAGWEQQLETQVESKHYPDIDAKAAAHELHGFKVALYRLGMIGKSETEVDPDHFEPNKLEEPEPTSPTETEPDTFIHANKGIRSEWTVRKVYGLGLMVWRPGLPLFYIPDSSTAFQTIHGAVSSFVAFGPMWSARVTCLPRRSRHRAEKTPATSSSRSPAHSRRLRSSITSATIPSTRGSPLTSRRSPGLRAASRNT